MSAKGSSITRLCRTISDFAPLSFFDPFATLAAWDCFPPIADIARLARKCDRVVCST
jgi:hypothetical protein